MDFKIISEYTDEEKRVEDEKNELNEYYLKKIEDSYLFEIEKLTPFFQQFFQELIDKKPDVLVFFDKSARPLALPIHKYLRILKEKSIIKSIPNILFWNTDSYKEVDKKMDYLKEKGLLDKKIFFIDETIDSGSFVKSLFKVEAFQIPWDCFAFSYNADDSPDRSRFSALESTKQVHISDLGVKYALFTKYLANLTVADYLDEGTDSFVTKKINIVPKLENGDISYIGLDTRTKARLKLNFLRKKINKKFDTVLISLRLTDN